MVDGGRLATLCVALGGCLAVLACAAPPTAPPAPAVPTLTGPHRVSGVLVSTQTRAPLGGATVTLSDSRAIAAKATVTTAPDGSFAFESVPVDRVVLTISASGHLDRMTYLQVETSRQDVRVDVISTAAPFSLDFFRQFTRRGFEQPNSLNPLNPWSTNPSYYIRTRVEDTGELVSALVVDGLRRVFSNAVPELSGGKLVVAAFEYGEEERAGRSGWVNVSFVRGLSVGGLATVGPSAAPWMKIRYDPALDEGPIFSGCESVMVEIADHEIVHTMGYSHTDQVGNDFRSGKGCPGAGRPYRVRYHAAIMYSRTKGNLDVDRDPADVALLSGDSVGPSVMSGPWHFFR